MAKGRQAPPAPARQAGTEQRAERPRHPPRRGGGRDRRHRAPREPAWRRSSPPPSSTPTANAPARSSPNTASSRTPSKRSTRTGASYSKRQKKQACELARLPSVGLSARRLWLRQAACQLISKEDATWCFPAPVQRQSKDIRKSSLQALVARSAEASHLAPARLYRYRAHPCSCGQSLVCGVALSPIAYVGYQRGGRKRTVRGCRNKERNTSPSG